jgi:hypothetical protein
LVSEFVKGTFWRGLRLLQRKSAAFGPGFQIYGAEEIHEEHVSLLLFVHLGAVSRGALLPVSGVG